MAACEGRKRSDLALGGQIEREGLMENHQNLATGSGGEGLSLRQYHTLVDPRHPLDVPTYERAFPIPPDVVNGSFSLQVPDYGTSWTSWFDHRKGVEIFGLDVLGGSFLQGKGTCDVDGNDVQPAECVEN